MDENERYVRERWEFVDEGGRIHIGDCEAGQYVGSFDSFAAAKAFTVEHERQIAEVQKAINALRKFGEEWLCDSEVAAFERILAVEQERLAALKQGMKQ